MIDIKKTLLEEVEIQEGDLSDLNFIKYELVRVHAVRKKFTNVSFKQSIIKECYFRRCIFRDCDFTGANISSTNFQGSDFIGCTFNYTTFTTTNIGITPLSKNLPSWENLKMHLAKNLRINYASIGDYEGVNFAINIELSATLEHLKKAAFSKESYYRGKSEFSGLGRVSHGIKYLFYLFFDLLWGNGEKPLRMFASIPFILAILALMFTLILKVPILSSIEETINIFFIGGESTSLGFIASSIANTMRYIVIGLFVSSLVRRLSRR